MHKPDKWFPSLHSSSPPRKRGSRVAATTLSAPLQARGRPWVPAFAGMTERGRYLALSRTIARRRSGFRRRPKTPLPLLLLFFAAKYQPSIGRPPRTVWFSIGMRLLKQQRTWLFVAALRFFAKARSIVDRKCMAAGDYQLDSEIATRNSYLSNYGKDPSAAWRFLCHAPQTAASGGLRSFAATAANDDVAP